MKTHKIGIIMNGVTGRMGTNQHLLRSIKAIIDQVGYRGFVPFEALQGGGSPAVIAAFFHKIREGLGLA